jgi:uncharacterized protein YceK
MKNLILILLLLSTCSSIVSAQDASVNRKKIIEMVLSQSHVRSNMENNSHTTNICTITPIASAPQGFRTMSTIPKYCLAKGAVICRLEEYVQLHSPFKLNIGVGGE